MLLQRAKLSRQVNDKIKKVLTNNILHDNISNVAERTNESRQRSNKNKLKKLLTNSCECDKISPVVKTTRSTGTELRKNK